MITNYFIIDFDSTLVQVEALDELAHITLKQHSQKTSLVQQIKDITTLGMEGKISFTESLSRRLELFHIEKYHIEKLVRLLKKKITPSIERNKDFFQNHKDTIYIISGGFKEYITPIAKMLGISESNILANEFKFDKNGQVIGYDTKNPLSQKGGKAKAIKQLKLKGIIHVIGDGFTDYEIKSSFWGVRNERLQNQLTSKRSWTSQDDEEKNQKVIFYAFTENVSRELVTQNADHVIPNFDEFLFLNHFPRSLSYPKNRIKVLLLENIDQVAIDTFQKEGYVVESLKTALGEKELSKKIIDVSLLGIRSKTEITSQVLENAKKLLAVGAFCIGTNQIDSTTAAQKGIVLFNAPFSNTRSVVELVLGEIIMLYRNTFDKSIKMHNGMWDKSAKGSHEIRGKKLGIIGYGNIGSQLSVLAENLGMEVYFYNTSEKLALGTAKQCSSMTELLRISDVITVHVSGKKSNTHLIGEPEFTFMKDGVLFLNLSRGFVVDLQALAKHVQSGKIAGAAVDVFPKEPKNNAETFESELRGLPNVILTPHVGGSTEEAQKAIGEFVSQKLLNFINSGDTMLSTNFPNLQLPKLHHAHRLIHIHKNVAGVLAKINGIFAKHTINIEGQYLGTNQHIGYVITDVAANYPEEVINELRKIPETIRLRVLY